MTGRDRHNDKKLLVLMANSIAVLMPIMFILAGISLLAQVPAPSAATTEPSADSMAAPFAFDVATIKPGDPSGRYLSGGGFSPSGYKAVDFPLAGIVFSAHFSLIARGVELVGTPAWAQKEH